MNILYISDSTTVSGAEIVLLAYLEALQPPQYHTHVFLQRANRRLADALTARDISFTLTDSYSRILLETTFNPSALRHFALAFYRVRRELIRVIRDRQIDLIHAISYPASLYASLAARQAKIPQIWHEHNIKHIHRINRLLYRFVASTCSWIVGPSDAVTKNLEAAVGPLSKLVTLYNGIALHRFTPCDERAQAVRMSLGLDDDEFAVGLFGQMLPYKGHKTLISAAHQVLRRHPKTRFFFVGARENPPYEEELRSLLTEQRLQNQFHFTGWRDDVPDVIRAMDVVTVATLTPEPAALALMEAMAMARPVVGSRTGGTAELILDRESGLLFPPGDASALAERIGNLLGNPGLRATLGAAGRQRIETKFGLGKHLAAMTDLYRRSLPTGSHRL